MHGLWRMNVNQWNNELRLSCRRIMQVKNYAAILCCSPTTPGSCCMFFMPQEDDPNLSLAEGGARRSQKLKCNYSL